VVTNCAKVEFKQFLKLKCMNNLFEWEPFLN